MKGSPVFLRRFPLAGKWLVTGGLMAALLGAPATALGNYYFLPLALSYTGLSGVASGYFGGVSDYFTLLNDRDGGINGIPVAWEECETEYDPAKGMRCYHRYKKDEAGRQALYFDSLTLYFHPLSKGVFPALATQGRRDRLPVVSVNHGPVESRRGDVFPYQFPLGAGTYDFAHAAILHMGERLGGMEQLKGLTIVTLYHGSPYGRATNEFLESLGEHYGFRHEAIEVPHPGNEQGSQWLRIRKLKPAFVYLRGWGLMNPVAIQTAVRTGYRVANLIGSEWSNSEEDVIPASHAAHGYQAAVTHRAGADFPLAQEIIEKLYNQGKGDLDDRSRIGSTYWNLGVWAAAMSAEAVRIAQERFGKELTGAMVRWGFENLDLNDEDVEEMGFSDIAPPIRVTCIDHAAVHSVRFQEWDAEERKWKLVTGWIDGDSDFAHRIAQTNAEKYAQEHPEFPKRDCGVKEDRDGFDL